MIDSISFVKFKTICVLYVRELFKKNRQTTTLIFLQACGLVV